MSHPFENEVALVAGAASGIGLAIAKAAGAMMLAAIDESCARDVTLGPRTSYRRHWL